MPLLRFHPFLVIDRPPLAYWVPSRVRARIEEVNRIARRAYLKKVLGGGEFPIVAGNCWGAGLYQDLEQPFCTPFIGLFLRPPCFIKYIQRYDEARLAPLRFLGDTSRYVGKVRYPLGGLLDDIEIHFVHYKSPEEARDKWERRRVRLPENRDDAYFMLGTAEQTLEDKRAFATLPVRSKVLFSPHPTPGFADEIVVPSWRGDGMKEGPGLYDHCHARFDMVKWLRREGDPSRG